MLLEAEAHSDKIMPHMIGTARFIVVFMSVLVALGTGLCTLILTLTCGLAPLNALYHGFSLAASSVGTAGILRHAGGDHLLPLAPAQRRDHDHVPGGGASSFCALLLHGAQGAARVLP